MLRHPSFSSKLCLLAIDELHLVNEWKDFRPAYFGLKVLRTRLPVGVPLLGVSATLDAKTLDIVQERCGFAEDTVIMKTALDRPEIYLQVSPMCNPINTMLNLQHLLPTTVTIAQDIPKTIIFMDSIAEVVNGCQLMRKWIQQLSYPMEAARVVVPFFAAMATRDKRDIAMRFSMPADQCLSPRILIATDAYGLGVDNPDVKRVVQWLLPSSIQKLYQRMGRAMRCGRGQAHFTLLHPPWCVSPETGAVMPDSVDPNDNAVAEPLAGSRRSRANQADADRRARMAPGLYDLTNVAAKGCIRDVGLDFFDDEEHRKPDYTKPFPCCSICDPELQTSIAPPAGLKKSADENSLTRPWFTAKLQAWRNQKAIERFTGSYLQFVPSLILPDEALADLAKWAEYIHDERSMRQWVGSAWPGLPLYCSEILEILRQGQAMESDRGEIFDEWVMHNDIKRKRCPDPLFNVEQAEFEERRASWMFDHRHKVTIKNSVKRLRGAAAKKSITTKSGPNKNLTPGQPGETGARGDPEIVAPTAGGQADKPGDDDGQGVSPRKKTRRPVKPPTTRRYQSRQPLKEILTTEPVTLSPTRSRKQRRLPSRYQ